MVGFILLAKKKNYNKTILFIFIIERPYCYAFYRQNFLNQLFIFYYKFKNY